MKVSKNLKKLRGDKNISQEALAEKLFVSRKTISSWETGRTQPDIEMLTKIADIFETDIETLIYGEKRFSKEEDYNKAKRKTIAVVFSVLATVLVTVGVILIFVTGWETMPMAVKSIFSVLPMLCGQALAIFTYLKKRKSALWCECAGVAWGAGVIATMALIDTIYGTKIGFLNCLLLDTLMLLPIVYILDALTPLAAYFVCSIWYSAGLFDKIDNNFVIVLFCTVLIASGVLYTVKMRSHPEKPQFIFAVWFSLIAAFVEFILISLILNDTAESYFTFPLTAAAAICVFCFENGKIKTKPFENIAFMILSVIGCIGTALISLATSVEIEFSFALIIQIIVSLLTAGTCLFIKRESLKSDKLRLIYCILSLAYLVFANFSFNMTGIYWAFSVIISIAMTVCIIATGIMRTDFWLLNLGLVATIVQIIIMVIMLIEFDMLTGGILLVLMGASLFSANFLVAKKAKEEKKEVANNEKQ